MQLYGKGNPSNNRLKAALNDHYTDLNNGNVYRQIDDPEGSRWQPAGNTQTLTQKEDANQVLSLLGSYLTTASAAATYLTIIAAAAYQTISGLFTSVMALVLTGFAAGANTAVAATDTLAQALAKLQGQINARPNETASTIGTIIDNSAAATPNDTDVVATAQSAVVKKITWTNVKAFLKTYFDTLYSKGAIVSKNTDYNPAVAGDLVVYDTNGANRTVTLPASPSANDTIGIYLQTQTSNYTITIERNGKTIGGAAANQTLYIAQDFLILQYDGTGDWVIASQNLAKHKVTLARAAAQSITINVDTAIQFDTTVQDTGSLADLVTTKSVVIRRAGEYLANVWTMMTITGATKTLYGEIFVNSSLVAQTVYAGTAANLGSCLTTAKLTLAAGDVVYFYVYQTDSTQNTSTAIYRRPTMSVIEL